MLLIIARSALAADSWQPGSFLTDSDRARRERKKNDETAPQLGTARGCGDQVTIEQTTTKQFGDVGQSVTGIVRHYGEKRIRNLKVCAGEVCTLVYGASDPGSETEFYLDADHMMGRGTYKLSTVCAVEE
jgi:hypothetical protein